MTEGLRHWIWQRLSAILFLGVLLWMALLLPLPSSSVMEWRGLIASVHGGGSFVLLLLFLFWHLHLGLAVVVDDYVSHEKIRSMINRVLALSSVSFCLLGVGSVVYLMVGGA